MTKEELVEQARKLILQQDYDAVIALLDDDTLNRFPDSSLFNWRGLSYKNRENFDLAIADYSKAIEMQPDYVLAYHNRGLAWDLKGEPDKAIPDFKKAIEFDPQDAEYYNGLGVALDSKREYDQAIISYKKAIELDSNFRDAYNNLGIAWDNKGEYDKALAYYAKAIEIDPFYHLPYLNRGSTYEHLAQPEKALADYCKAIELKPDFSHAYAHIGFMLSKEGKHEEALKYFEQARNHSPFSKYFQKLLDEAKAKLGKEITVVGESTGFSARYVENEIRTLTEEEKKPIRKICAVINERVEGIRKMMLYKGSEPVVHYTQLRTADIVVMNKDARLRYSNVVFMNDPEEGKVLIDYLLDASLRRAFDKGRLEGDNNIYLGSFLPEDKADYLVMWRTYGKNELNEEATGCSITLNRNFFDTEDRGLYTDMRFTDTDPTERQALFHVLYFDKNKNGLVTDGDTRMICEVTEAMTKLQSELDELLKLKDEDDRNDEGLKNTSINKFVYRYVSELRYFFKSSDYQFEKELRVIKYCLTGDVAVKTDADTKQLPRRLYIESTRQVRPHISRIILGPKVPHPERWTYLESVMKQSGNEMKLEYSKVKFQ